MDNFKRDTPPIKSPTTQTETSTNSNAIVDRELNLDNIFSSDHAWKESLPKAKTITLIATGDVMLGRTINSNNIKNNNFLYPFEKTAEFLKAADLTLINLEGPLNSPCPAKNDGMIFCGDVRNIEGLKFADIDVANLANNHSSNYGKEGLLQTEQLLTDAGILISGLNGVTYKEIKGYKIAFLGFNDIDPRNAGVTPANEEIIKNEIEDAKSKSDFIIVSFHWGVEYQSQPTTKQKYLAHFAVDNGADLIIGNHPHWFQPVEIYNNKIIAYSHGNFIFDQSWSQKTQEGIIGIYTIYENKIVDVEFIPNIIKKGQPEIAQKPDKERLISELKSQSLLLQNSQ